MKKHLLITFFLSIVGLSFAQATDSSYAKIKFYGGALEGHPPIKIYLGDQPPFTLGENQVITFNVYSKKGMRIAFRNDDENYDKWSFRFIVKGTTYYYIAQFADHHELLAEADVDKFNARVKKSKNVEQITIDEDLSLVQEKTKPYSSGTGFFISSDGYLVTNSHVVDKAVKITARGVAGDFTTKHKVKVVFNDQSNDIALLKMENMDLKLDHVPYTIRTSGVETGEEIFVLGYPLKTVMGEEIKLTTGIVSSKSGFEGSTSTYQISATVQSGNSGSPLFDKNGNLIGIVNAKLQGAQSVNYAIKITYLKSLLESSETPNELNGTNSTASVVLSDLVKKYSNFICIIETEK